jgi:S-adenosylmethionine:tRNA ribosyltransferase-isomerase
VKLKDFDYNLPKNLIAQKPVSPRDRSRLLVLHKKSGEIEHKHFYDIIDYLKAGDALVLNNTKVMPARLIGKRVSTGGKVEVFLLKKSPLPLPREYSGHAFVKGGNIWQCLIGSQRRKENLKIEFTKGLKAEIIKNNLDGTWNVKFNKSGGEFMKIVQKIGRVPLPPYIKRMPNVKTQNSKLMNDKINYQTVYADDKKIGSVAAPTAGFHFTPALLEKLKNKGVQIEYVTLQVGLGTFAPVKVDDIAKHKMHAERIEINKKTLGNIIKAKLEGRRIVAVGTTSVRTLEAVFNELKIENCLSRLERGKLKIRDKKNCKTKEIKHRLVDYKNWVNIFIYPGYKFRIVDAMITNFHLPKSTLVMLVSALAGRKKIFTAYREAIKKKYRFYSYGDAMLIV